MLCPLQRILADVFPAAINDHRDSLLLVTFHLWDSLGTISLDPHSDDHEKEGSISICSYTEVSDSSA